MTTCMHPTCETTLPDLIVARTEQLSVVVKQCGKL